LLVVVVALALALKCLELLLHAGNRFVGGGLDLRDPLPAVSIEPTELKLCVGVLAHLQRAVGKLDLRLAKRLRDFVDLCGGLFTHLIKLGPEGFLTRSKLSWIDAFGCRGGSKRGDLGLELGRLGMRFAHFGALLFERRKRCLALHRKRFSLDLRLGLRLVLSGLFFFGACGLSRIAIAGELTKLLGDVFAVGKVREVHRNRHHPQSHLRRKACSELVEVLEHHLAQGAGVVLFAHHKISHRGSDVVGDPHRPVGLKLRGVDPHPFECVLGAGEPDHFGLGVPLLDQAQLLFALDLHRVAQVIEGLGGDNAPLQLACLDRFARDRIGLPPHVLLGDARRLLDRGGCKLHHLDLAGGRIGVAADLELSPGLFDDHPIGAIGFLAHHIPVVDGALIGNDLVGVEHEERFRCALVEVLLHIAHPPDHPIRKPVAALAVAPDRGEREAVVAVGAWLV